MRFGTFVVVLLTLVPQSAFAEPSVLMPLDEPAGSYLFENRGTSQNQAECELACPATTSGRFGAALYLDGESQSLRMQHHSSFELSQTGTLTIAAWVTMFNDSYQYGSLLMKTSSGAWNNGYGIFMNPAGDLCFFVGSYQTAACALPPIDQMFHLAATFDGTTARLYFDGEIAAEKIISQPKLNSYSAPLLIGKGAGPVGDFIWSGIIDELSIRQVVWSDTEVLAASQAIGPDDYQAPPPACVIGDDWNNDPVVLQQLADVTALYESLRTDHSALQSSHTQLQQDYASLQTANSTLQESYLSLEQSHQKLQEEHLALQEKYTGLQAKHEALQGRYDTLKDKYDDLRKKYRDLKAELRKLQRRR